MKAKTYRSTRHMSLAELIGGLNRLLRGWANYFRHAVAKDVLNAIDSFTWRRVVRPVRRLARMNVAGAVRRSVSGPGHREADAEL